MSQTLHQNNELFFGIVSCLEISQATSQHRQDFTSQAHHDETSEVPYNVNYGQKKERATLTIELNGLRKNYKAIFYFS